MFPAAFSSPRVCRARTEVAETGDALIAETSHKTKAKIELLLAGKFPKPDLPAVLRPVATGVVETGASTEPAAAPTMQLVPEPVVPSVGRNRPS
jgi:hypothetical protein